MFARTSTLGTHRVSGTGRGLLGWIIDIDTTFRQRQALGRMDDAALKDVGLGRSDVRSEMSRAVWDVPGHWRA